MNGTSLHEAVRTEITKRIASGVYKPGDAIASTAQLGEEFNVSPITIKRAVRDLQSAGVLTSIPGRGTFVKERRRYVSELDFWSVGTDTDSMRHLGFEPTLQLLSITKETITDPALGVFDPPKTPQLCVRKVIYADGVPIMYDSSYVSPRLPDHIVDEFGDQLVIGALRHNNIDVTSERILIDAAPASPAAQQTFAIPNGYPTLRRLYHIKTSKPGLAVIGIVESPFDRLACSISLSPPARKKRP